MEIYTTEVPAARLGAAFYGVRSPWASLVAVGANHALAPNAVLAVGSPGSGSGAFRPVMVPRTQSALTAAQLLPTVNAARTQKNILKTRTDAGGSGAMGPYPEREQPA